MILVNVLLIVALASAVVALMLTAQDDGVQRAVRLWEASRAIAAIDGGELSAIAALRRDALVAPASDNLAEPWARIRDRAVPIPGGRFTLAIADAQAKFNLNALTRRDLVSRDLLARIVAGLGLPADMATRVSTIIGASGPIDDLAQLAAGGIDPGSIARLATLTTALPGETEVNVNTADQRLLGLMMGNQVAGRLLAAQRERRGFLTNDDFARAHAILPPGTGFASNLYWVRVRVSINDTTQERTSLVLRRHGGGGVEVAVIDNWIGAAAPMQVPPP